MANLGNCVHIPNNNPENHVGAGGGNARTRSGAIVPANERQPSSLVNQFQGAGNPGNQLQTGSALFFKRTADTSWTSLPLIFLRTSQQQTVLLGGRFRQATFNHRRCGPVLPSHRVR